MSLDKIFAMNIKSEKDNKCAACNKTKSNACQTVKDAANCKDLKSKKSNNTNTNKQ